MANAAGHNVELKLGSLRLRVKDPVSAATHFAGCIAALLAAAPLVLLAWQRLHSVVGAASFALFMLSMAALYAASATYHTFDIPGKTNILLKKLDHCMIFVLIAGSYSPFCVAVFPPATGIPLLATIWVVALLGIVFKLFWVTCPKWVSSVIYIGMGWLSVVALPAILAGLPAGPFAWLLGGGVAYTVGGVIYALKLPLLEHAIPGFGAHELFHCFVLLGSLCHYLCLCTYLLGL